MHAGCECGSGYEEVGTSTGGGDNARGNFVLDQSGRASVVSFSCSATTTCAPHRKRMIITLQGLMVYPRLGMMLRRGRSA
jgi:hypothetical protein